MRKMARGVQRDLVAVIQVLTPSSGLLDFAISMRPDYHRAIIDTVRYYGWKKIIYLYDSHDGKSSLPRGFLMHFSFYSGRAAGCSPVLSFSLFPQRFRAAAEIFLLFIIAAK